MIKVAFAFLLAVVALLQGCTVSREQFRKDVEAVVTSPDASLPGFDRNSDPDGKLKNMLRRLLQDEEIQKAVYDRAVRAQVAWSSDAILRSDWYPDLRRRGLSRLPATEQAYLLRAAAMVVDTLPAEECAGLFNRKSLSLDLEKLPPSERERMIEFTEKALRAGASPGPTPKKPAKADLVVALTALCAKAKEQLSDLELAEMFLPLMEPKERKGSAACRSAKQILQLTLALEPKYQQVLVNEMLK